MLANDIIKPRDPVTVIADAVRIVVPATLSVWTRKGAGRAHLVCVMPDEFSEAEMRIAREKINGLVRAFDGIRLSAIVLTESELERMKTSDLQPL
jgi:hypothetical protein